MSQSLVKNLIHLIFSTKERRPLIDRAIRESLHAYAAGILRDADSPGVAINSVNDHMHLLFNLNKNIALVQAIMQVKKGTSRWIKTQGPQYASFAWQNGYGAFSVSESAVGQVIKYIGNQEENHRVKDFQGEFRSFLQRHRVAFDERYLWD